MSITDKIESLVLSRNTIRTKMKAVGQAGSNDKLATLASNLNILDTSDANATENDILTGKTAYVNGEKIVGTATAGIDTSDATATADDIIAPKTAYVNGIKLTGTATAGIDTSDATATASNIDSGKTAYVDGSKITGTSTKTDTSDATLSSNNNLLSGNTAYSKGVKYTGSMVNQGAKTATLNCGNSYTIPQGYHNGNGSVSANSLSSQTQGTATASDIISQKTAWVNGSKVTGNIVEQSTYYNHIVLEGWGGYSALTDGDSITSGGYWVNPGYYDRTIKVTLSDGDPIWLWSNPDPHTSFQGQDITLEDYLFNYDFLVIYFKVVSSNDYSGVYRAVARIKSYSDYSYLVPAPFMYPLVVCHNLSTPESSNTRYRMLYCPNNYSSGSFDDKILHFTDCIRFKTASTQNSYIIPVHLYGYTGLINRDVTVNI